jgi:hypothetical protein
MNIIRFCAFVLIVAVVNGYSLAPVNAATSQQSPAGSFGGGHAYFHPTQRAPYRFVNTVVRLDFDFARGIVYGDETATVRPKQSGMRDLPFNTAGIHYERVTVNGRSAAYTFDAGRELINVHLPAQAPPMRRSSSSFVIGPSRREACTSCGPTRRIRISRRRFGRRASQRTTVAGSRRGMSRIKKHPVS